MSSYTVCWLRYICQSIQYNFPFHIQLIHQKQSERFRWYWMSIVYIFSSKTWANKIVHIPMFLSHASNFHRVASLESLQCSNVPMFQCSYHRVASLESTCFKLFQFTVDPFYFYTYFYVYFLCFVILVDFIDVYNFKNFKSCKRGSVEVRVTPYIFFVC